MLLHLSKANQIEMPVLSLCFQNPIINEKLKEFNEDKESDTFNKDKYLKYLEGNSFDDQFERVDYQTVTLNLGNYFLYLKESWHNDSNWENSSLITDHIETFNGFYHNRLLKCFSMKNDIGANRHIRGLSFYYDLEKLFNDLTDTDESWMTIFWKIHYPGQFFLGDAPVTLYLYQEQFYDSIWIMELEILERRNSGNRKCSEESTSYDKMILKKYLSRKGCKTPYISYNTTLPGCNMTSNTREIKLDYYAPETLHIPEACKRMTKVRITNNHQRMSTKQKAWSFYFHYPKEVKIITQSKEVDLHALIGNIGGYLGLFLGTYIYTN